MSTPCLISKKNSDNTFRTIYCHFDGSLKWAGKKLVTYFNTEELVDKLLDLGDMSALGKIPEGYWSETLNFDIEDDRCMTYRERGEDNTEAEIYSEEEIQRHSKAYEFNYFFIDGEWYYGIYSGQDLKKVEEE